MQPSPHPGFPRSISYPASLALIASLIRLIPIIIAWPFPVGFDTNAFYLPWMFQTFPSTLGELFKDTLLSQLFMNGVYLIYPHPFGILNAFGIFFQVALALCVYLYARKVVRLSHGFSFVAGLAFTLNLLTLRLTWDQYRMALGLIFVILTWVLLSTNSPRSLKFFAVPTAILMVFSNPLPTLVFIGSMVVYLALKRSEIKRMYLELSTTLIVLALQILELALLFTSPNSSGAPVEGLGTFGNATASLQGLYYLAYTSWPLLAIVPIAIRRIRKEYHWTWLVSVLVLVILGPIVGLGPISQFGYWMISFPLAIIFGLTCERNRKMIVKFLVPSLIIVSLVLALFWVTSTPEAPNLYFSTSLTGKGVITPVGYLQTTVDLPFQAQLMSLLNQSINSVPKNSTIYFPAQFYGFALVTPNLNGVKLTNIGEIAPSFYSTSFYQIDSRTGSYTVWLTKPNGWYGVFAMPPNFRISINGGEFSLYYISSLS